MDAVAISRIGGAAGQEACVRGWLYNKRSSGKIQFLILRDGTGYCQCVVVKAEVEGRLGGGARRLTQESSLEIVGKVRKDERAPGGYELRSPPVEVLGPSPRTTRSRRRSTASSSCSIAAAPLAALVAAARRAARPLRGRAGDPRTSSTSATSPDRLADPDGPPARGPRRSSRPTTSARRRTSRSRGSSTSSPRPRRSARCTASARRSAPRSRRRGGT